jgi:hypothetical protein
MTTTKRLRALLAEATPGPWRFGDAHPDELVVADSMTLAGATTVVCYGEPDDEGKADAALIAAAVNALPALLDVAEAARDYLAHDRDTNALAAALAQVKETTDG